MRHIHRHGRLAPATIEERARRLDFEPVIVKRSDQRRDGLLGVGTSQFLELGFAFWPTARITALAFDERHSGTLFSVSSHNGDFTKKPRSKITLSGLTRDSFAHAR
jgi:hypothetical protein